jgi:xanthine/CO dehydrogenase XdhC/CoxF family maturation factor
VHELQLIAEALTRPESTPAVLATLVSVAGSSYRRPGARLLVRADGSRLGSVSGGCLEEDVLARAERVRASGVAEAAVYDTTAENDLVWGVGLGCHGVVRVLIEPVPTPPAWAAAVASAAERRTRVQLIVTHEHGSPSGWGTRLVSSDAPFEPTCVFTQEFTPPPCLAIFGAGDDAMPLAKLAHGLGWRVVVADPRAALNTAERFPWAACRETGSADTLVARVFGAPAQPSSAADGGIAVVMTHHYVHDVPILRDLLPRRLAYVGLLGPRKRAERILADLTAEGCSISAEERARLHAPVGLDLGAEAPAEVAHAIVAEILAVLHGRDARPLRWRERPIHADS